MIENDSTGGDPAATVVIPAHNAERTLGVQLASLALQVDAPPFEVIVSDNGASDATAALVRSWSDFVPGLRWIDASCRSGPCAARNIGVEHARSEKLLFCDADDAVGVHWVAAMSRALDRYVIVGGKMLDDALNDPDVREWYPAIPSGLFTKFEDFFPYASGANLGVQKAALEAVHGWDETLTNGTDADLSFRVQRELGVEMAFAPEAVVQYRYRSDLRGLYRNMRQYGRAEIALLERHGHAGLSGRAPSANFRSIGWLILHMPDLAVSRGRRGAWVRRFGVTVGRLERRPRARPMVSGLYAGPAGDEAAVRSGQRDGS